MLISVIDTLAPSALSELVTELDACGYDRFWTTEHYSPSQSASPSIVAALAAGLTHNIRIGIAAYLVQYTSPARIVADLRLLSHLFGDRFDVALASAHAPATIEDLLLDGRPAPRPFGDRVASLTNLLRASSHPELGPAFEVVPALWIAGQSEASADLAAAHGASFAFHHYFSSLSSRPVDGPAVVARYRAARSDGHVAITCYGTCAADDAAASDIWRRMTNDTPTPSFLGPPARCAEQLEAIRARYDADELILQSIDDGPGRLRAYPALLEALRQVR